MPGRGLTGVGKSKIGLPSTPQLIINILNSEGIERVHIVGVSLGSLLAQSFALQYPDKTLSLTVLGGYDITREQKELAKTQRQKMVGWLFKMIFSMDAFRRHVASISVIDKVEQAHFYNSAKLFTRKSFVAMKGMDKLSANLGGVKRDVTLLLMAGDQDVKQAVDATIEWHEEEPDTQLAIIENAGHCANMDNADEFNERLMAFVSNPEQNRPGGTKLYI